MTFARVKPLGWAFQEKLTSVQQNTLDIDHANAIDGAAGGTYAPTNPLVIGGDGLDVSTIFSAEDAVIEDLQVTGACLIDVGATVAGTLVHNGTYTHTGSLDSIGTITHTGTIDQAGATNLVGTTTCDGALFVTASATVDGSVTVSGAISTFGGFGGFRKRFTLGADVSDDYGVNEEDEVHVASGTLSAPRTYTVVNTLAGAGSEIWFYYQGTTHTLTISYNAGANTFDMLFGTGSVYAAQLWFNGSVWARGRYSIKP